MKNKCPALCAAMLLAVVCADAADIHSKALYPVQWESPSPHAPLELVKNGKLQVAIIRDTKPEVKLKIQERSVMTASMRLAEAFKHCTGLDIPVYEVAQTEAAAQYPYKILLGAGACRELISKESILKLPKAGYILKTFPGGIAIAGHDSAIIPGFFDNFPGDGICYNGTLYGVMDFIERFLNCRFYFPGELGEIFPETKSVVIPPAFYSDYPRSNFRYAWNIGNSFSKARKEIYEPLIGKYEDPFRFSNFWRHGIESMMLANHSPYTLQWLKTHPDKKDTIFFRSTDGRLYFTPDGGSGGKFINVINLKCADLFVDDVKRFFETKGKWHAPWTWDMPNREYVGFGQCDANIPITHIQNDPVVKKLGLVTDEHLKRPASGTLSDVYARFYSHIGRRFQKELPGLRLGALIYADYTLPPILPEYQNIPDNVDLRVCLMDMPSRVRDPKSVKRSRDILQGWRKACGGRKVKSLWLYDVPGKVFVRSLCARFIGDVMKTFEDDIQGDDLLYCFWNDLDWYYYYSIYPGLRAMWNPDVDIDAMVDESWGILYGEYGPKLKAFHDHVLRCYMKYYIGQNVTKYPNSELITLEKIMKELEPVMVQNTVIARRMRFFFTPWQKAIPEMRTLNAYIKPSYSAHKIKTDAPAAKDWDAAKTMTIFDPNGGIPDFKFKTDIRMLWNSKGIFCRVISAGKPLCDDKKDLFAKDNIEFIISTGLAREKLYQIVISADGQLFSGRQEFKPIIQAYDAAWKCKGLQYKVVERNDKGWTLELFVPFDGIYAQTPSTYSSWLVNIVRNKHSEPKEYSATSMTQNGNRNMEQFGFIKFSGAVK